MLGPLPALHRLVLVLAELVGVIGKRLDPTEIPGPDDVAGRHH